MDLTLQLIKFLNVFPNSNNIQKQIESLSESINFIELQMKALASKFKELHNTFDQSDALNTENLREYALKYINLLKQHYDDINREICKKDQIYRYRVCCIRLDSVVFVIYIIN